MPTAFVTGAGVRIGAAIARALAQSGFDLILHANASIERLTSHAASLASLSCSIKLVQGDLSTIEGVLHIAQEVQKLTATLDLLVNNAAIYESVPFDSISESQYRRMMAINLDAPFFLTQALMPQLRSSPVASVINVTDIGGDRPVRGYAHYSISKAGLIMMTKTLAIELAPHIRVNGVSPGAIVFPENFTTEQKDRELARVPMHREGSPDDIAKAVVFLATQAPYITGQILNVDGGWSASI